MSAFLRRAGGRLLRAGWWLVIGGVFALAVLVPATVVAVEHSSQPEFCTSCHLMQPYYDSWARSAHAGVRCIECHFEPGTMGTVRGKFQALSQLAKYVTHTQGTRPWAQVDDGSCLRSGCHSTGALEGPVAFGRVSFDHRPHLLESRGQRLRCVTCHSQVLVDEHFAVEPGVCFTCHFMPGADGRIPRRTGECTRCHGAPGESLAVAGRPFVHADYLARGVECQACHADAVQGTGAVHAQRCRSCHGQAELLERRGDAQLLHRVHVSERKVECAECHLEIRHGRPDPLEPHPAGDESCDACHATPHEAARLVYAGTGASGVAERESRMHATHVACEACHTGRAPGAGALAAASETECLHCHGTRFAGMLAEWQGAVERGRAGLEGELQALAAADPAAAAACGGARENLALLARDGSHGAHNAPYALDVLRAAAEDVAKAWARVDPAHAGPAALLPAPADAECAACHLDVARHDPQRVNGRDFAHRPHLAAAGLACSACHARESHGAPAFPRAECASCHHSESERLDPSDCARCHADQQAFFTGALPGGASGPVTMAEKECTSCHGEPPDIVLPQPSLCVLCHEPGYDEKLAAWRARTDELVARLERALAEAKDPDERALAAAREAQDLVTRDGSRGVHNAQLAEQLLQGALERLGAR